MQRCGSLDGNVGPSDGSLVQTSSFGQTAFGKIFVLDANVFGKSPDFHQEAHICGF